MDIYERLYHEIEANGFLADPMTVWVGDEGCCGKASGFLIANHIGLDQIRQLLCGDTFKAYAIRESDELNCEPATIENREVMVNFFGYFITETDLDWCFRCCDWQEVYNWDYDPVG